MNLTGQAQPGFTSTGTGAGTFPGFGTGPTGSGPAQQDWSGFLNALNPQSTAANTWFGMNPQDLSFMNSFQSPGFGPGGGPSPGDWEGFLGALNPGTPAGTGYDPFTDSSVNMPWLSPDQTPTGTVYDPFTDSSVNMGSTDTITPSWSDFEQSYFNQFLEGP